MSAFALKVRTGIIAAADFQQLRQRFYADVAQGNLIVLRVRRDHFDTAAQLIERYALRQRLRTLDALQLATALDLRNRRLLDTFVCADQSLCMIAAAEGVTVFNPEQP